MARKFNREILRILLLIPLLVVMGLLFMWQSKPRFEDSLTRYANLAIDSVAHLRAASKSDYTSHRGNQSSSQRENTGDLWSGNDNEDGTGDGRRGGYSHHQATTEKAITLFEFDPNSVNLNELMRLGFSQKQAQGILNYRKAGAIFRTVADFGRCYTVSDEKLQQLLPYINIGIEYRKGHGLDTKKWSSTLEQTQPETQPSLKNLGTSAPSIINNHSNPSSAEAEVAFGVAPETSPQVAQGAALGVTNMAHEVYFTPPPIDLNSADSAALVKVRGIGSLSAQRIIEYRNRMGGIARVEQLQEVQGMNERNYLSIIQQIFIDSSGITKIDINFALPEQLKGHPYLPSRILNRLLKQRQLKGGWRDTGDLIEQNILSREEAEKLAPYLYFRPLAVRNQ